MNTFKIDYDWVPNYKDSKKFVEETEKAPTHINAESFEEAVQKLLNLNLEFYKITGLTVVDYIHVLQ